MPIFKNSIRLNPEFCLLLAFSLLVLPIRWVLAWMIAASIHELWHYRAIKFCCGQVHAIEIGMGGAKMEADIPSHGKEFLCAIAGPVGSLFLLLLVKWLPRVALCGLIQAAYNLLPFFPLDGGRAVRSLVKKYIPRWYWVTEALERGTMLLLFAIGLYCSIKLSLGIFPVLIPVILFLKQGKIKIPCKRLSERVQ